MQPYECIPYAVSPKTLEAIRVDEAAVAMDPHMYNTVLNRAKETQARHPAGAVTGKYLVDEADRDVNEAIEKLYMLVVIRSHLRKVVGDGKIY